MNNQAVNTRDNISTFNEGLQGANEDWPLLGQLSNKKFNIKGKKGNANVASITQSIIESSLREDGQASELAVNDDKTFVSSFNNDPKDVKAIQEHSNSVKSIVNDESLVKAEKVALPKQVIQPVVQTTFNTVVPAVKPKMASSESNRTVQSNQFTNKLLKLIAIGLTKLYISKTTRLLNPVKFVADNYKNILVASLHLGIPILMSWFLITKVGFVKEQMVDTSGFIFWSYAVVFYFASLFAWVTGQVLFAGLISMFKTTLVSVANNVENEN